MLELEILTAAIAAAVAKDGAKFVKKLSADLLRAAKGEKAVTQDPAANRKAFAAMIKQLGGIVHG